MYRAFASVFIVYLSLAAVRTAQGDVVSRAPSKNNQISETVHYAGPGVTAPELIPSTVSVSHPWHCHVTDGVVILSAVVDAGGAPRELKTIYSDSSGLASFAVKLVTAEGFKPGTFNGVAAAVAIELTIGLQACAHGSKSASGSAEDELKLSSSPTQSLRVRSIPPPISAVGDDRPSVYRVGGSIAAPVPITTPEAKYSREAKGKRIQGICLIGLIVDAKGMPQNVRVIHSLEPSLDQNAIEAVRAYRFKPAMKDGTIPVPVYIDIEVNFRLY